MSQSYSYDVAIIGSGLAGIATAIELLDNNIQVAIFDASTENKFGGMANEAFGGMLLVDTPIQRKHGINDSPDLAFSDWCSAAEFSERDALGKQWAEAYVNESIPEIYLWLKQRNISFLPMPHWVERGDFRPGNSVPRYHIVWGTGYGLTQTLIKHLLEHKNADKLSIHFQHKVTEFDLTETGIKGFSGINGKESDQGFSVNSEKVVICAGGINGNLDRTRKYWDTDRYGQPPANLKAGVSPDADGLLHEKAMENNISVINLQQMWNYAAGVAHPEPEYPHHAVSLIPPRSSLWMDAYGRRVGPHPMITGFDTHELCCRTGNLPGQYSWQIMNYKIALKELAASGSHINKNIKDKNLLGFAKDILLGNKRLLNYLIEGSEDVLIANSLDELMNKMETLSPEFKLDRSGMTQDISSFDNQIARGVAFHNDDQLRRIAQLRNWKGDKLRTCKYQPIVDSKHLPLIAIRSFLVSRKSMGGFETNLNSQVLDGQGSVIDGLYAAGEAAGFGGGGISGIRSLEGTFISSCIYNGRKAAQHITG